MLESNKFWTEDRVDLFETTKYKPFHDYEVDEEWTDLAYKIKRGKVDEAKKIAL